MNSSSYLLLLFYIFIYLTDFSSLNHSTWFSLVLRKHVSLKVSEEENTKSEVCFSQTGFAACSTEQRDDWATGHVGRCAQLSTAASVGFFSSPSEPLCSLSINCALLWAITTVYSTSDAPPHVFCVNIAHKLFVPLKMEVVLVCL